MPSSSDDRRRGADAPPVRMPIVVLISGRGSNLHALMEAAAHEGLPVVIRAVISDRPEAAGLEHARRCGIPVAIVARREYRARASFEAALAAEIERHDPALVVLAGFMRVLSPEFVQRFEGRMVNIHPSLLPRFPGLDTHRRAIEADAEEHGASVHFVTAEVDGGPLILQGRLRVERGEDPDRLADRVLGIEHRLYPLAIRLIAEGRVRMRDNKVLFDGAPLDGPLDLADFPVTAGHTR